MIVKIIPELSSIYLSTNLWKIKPFPHIILNISAHFAQIAKLEYLCVNIFSRLLHNTHNLEENFVNICRFCSHVRSHAQSLNLIHRRLVFVISSSMDDEIYWDRWPGLVRISNLELRATQSRRLNDTRINFTPDLAIGNLALRLN